MYFATLAKETLYYHLAIYTEIEIVWKEGFELCPDIGKRNTNRNSDNVKKY